MFDATGHLGQDLLFAGFPFIASTESAVKNMIVKEDRANVIVEPNGEALGNKFIQLIGKQGL